MSTKNKPINLKKIPLNIALILLTGGASIILGLLSFGGMYALIPVLPLAFAAFGLSVIYEMEIYLQNLKGAIKKLFKSNYLENHLAKEYLLQHFPKNTQDPECPQFFRDYKTQFELLNSFRHKELDSDSRKRKKQMEKTLKDMEKWFALQLFPAKNKPAADNSAYAKELQLWLAKNQQQETQEKFENRKFNFKLVKGFSILSGLFMGLGSTYLIVEAFSVIPFFAAIPFTLWPLMILPMAIVAGTAYGLLTFNTVTDLINNDTIAKLRDDLSQGLSIRNAFLLVLAGLAITLTICTAGTWWTVANNARPLFEWMKSMPSFIMRVINPIITGFSAIFFNIQNTSESIELVDKMFANLKGMIQSKEGLFGKIYNAISKGFRHVLATENWLQILNPFRILLKLTLAPLRIVLFLGHIISIGLTADRMPGLPQIFAFLNAVICEGFEDFHYLFNFSFDEEDEKSFEELLAEHLSGNEEHDHGQDIPNRLLTTIAYPIYVLAAAWDFAASKLINKSKTTDSGTPQSPAYPSTFNHFLNKQQGIKEQQEIKIPVNAERPSKEWQVEHTVSLIEKYQTKHFGNIYFGQELAQEKITELNALKKKIREPETADTLAQTLEKAKNQPVYNKHRLFTQGKTDTQEFVEELSERVNAPPPERMRA